jgi:D-alanine-D-alanine ligase
LDKIKDMTLQSYRALDIKDFGRIDVRVNEKGVPYFLECNPLPNLGLIDVFPLVARAQGTTYENMIVTILNYGIKRNGLI